MTLCAADAQKTFCSLPDRSVFLLPALYKCWQTVLQRVCTTLCPWLDSASRQGLPVYWCSAITIRHTTLLWTSDQPVAEAATYTTRNTRASTALPRYDPAISAGELPQTDALDRAATGIGLCKAYCQLTAYSFTASSCFDCKLAAIFRELQVLKICTAVKQKWYNISIYYCRSVNIQCCYNTVQYNTGEV